jgi:Serpin (serine protease inhibitor)
VAILPPTSATGCDVPTAGELAALTAIRAGQTAEVLLPKLRLSQSWPQLQDTVAAMGLSLSGDHSGLGAGDSQISQVAQKATMDVDQMGTAAAAATGIAIGSSGIAGNIVTINFDRPFLLILEDAATRTPLFLARSPTPPRPDEARPISASAQAPSFPPPVCSSGSLALLTHDSSSRSRRTRPDRAASAIGNHPGLAKVARCPRAWLGKILWNQASHPGDRRE